MLITFVMASVVGGAALFLPFVSHIRGLSFLDALFTATSAVCVTGLVTVPTSGFNMAGQLIILLLIQLGGIGIMTLTSSLILFSTNRLDLRHRMQAAQMTDTFSFKEVESVLKVILRFTAVTEAVGAMVMAVGFAAHGAPPGRALYLGLFHAVSAFCNAGFSTFDSSMVGQGSLVKVVTMVLIFLGGLGYYVIFDLMEYFARGDRLTNHTRVVLGVSLFLVAAGWAAFWGLEAGRLGPLDALFQSVTARTAGFNSVDIASMGRVSIFILLILMIVGASPGSTGGGVKTTTFFVAIASIYSALRGHTKVVVLGRRLPQSNVVRAFALIFLYCAFLCVGIGALLYTDHGEFLTTAFEVASALGTVGLSLGLTPHLSTAGKVIIILTMLAGRVGPATITLIFLRGERRSHVDYPEERLILG